MKKKKALFVCQNILEFKDKILPCFMFIVNKGYDIHIACDEKIDIAFAGKIHILQNTESLSYIKNKNNIRILEEVIKEERYDVVHTLDNVSSYIANIVLKRIKSNFIDFYAYVENVKKHIFKLKNTLKRADIVITNNEEDYTFVLDKKYNSNINLVYDLAIDFRKYNNLDIAKNKQLAKEKYNLQDEKKYVLAIVENNDYNYLINLIKEINVQNSKVNFLLKDVDDKNINNLEKSNCMSNITIIDDAKWFELLLASDTVLFSNIESYDLNLFIYSLMLGIPVIAPQETIAKNYIHDLKNGFLFHNKNVQQTILAIGKSINIPKVKLDELTKFNYNYISKFSQDKYVYNMSDMYLKVKEEENKDIYIIEDLRKREDTEKLMADIKNSNSCKPLIITIGTSVNDDKLLRFGAEIKNFRIKTFNEKLKFRKFLTQIFESGKYNSFSVYGKMNKILRKNKILLDEKNIISRYEKI